MSLKTIELIDTEVKNSEIVNKKYFPTPLDNSCCLDSLDGNYTYMEYFNKSELGKEIKNIDSSIISMEGIKNLIFNKYLNTYDIKSSTPISVLPSFKEIVFPDESSVTRNQIRDS